MNWAHIGWFLTGLAVGFFLCLIWTWITDAADEAEKEGF